MGCDIHTHVEYRANACVGIDENGNAIFRLRWLCGDYFKTAWYYRDSNKRRLAVVEICGERNYDRFATLANVRNYGGTPYISEPRGLPEDVTNLVNEDYESYCGDAHSPSYVTLKELIEYQSTVKPLKRSGLISPEAQKELDENGTPPREWCQGTTYDDWERREWEVENTVLIPLIEGLKERADKLGVIYKWEWEEKPVESLEKADNIRFVFWFDD